MKRICLIITAISAVLMWSCSNTEQLSDTGNNQLTITASLMEIPSTKTTLQNTAVYWDINDAIKVFYGKGSGKFISTNTSPAATASFKGSIDVVLGGDETFAAGEQMWGLYPYRANASYDGSSVTTTLPSNQMGRADSFGKDMNISLAKSSNLALAFYNVCGGLRFSVTRDDITEVVFEGMNDEILAGNIKVTFEDGTPAIQEISNGKKQISLTAPNKEPFFAGHWYYIVAAPGTLSNGFKLTFYTETQCAELVKSDEVTISRGKFGSVADADTGLTFIDSGRGTEARDPEEPFFSEGVELMSLIWRLAGASEFNGCEVADMNASVDDYFSSMKNHYAVSLATKLYYIYGISYDAVAAFGLHLLIQDDGQIIFNPDFNASFDNDSFNSRWTSDQRQEMLSAVNDFYNDSNFHWWFTSQEPLFRKGVEAFKKYYNINYEWYKRFFGTLENPSNQIILSYLVGGNNYGLSVQLPDNGIMSSPVIGCALQYQAGGELTYYYGTLDIIVHEFCHPYCNPLINKYWNSIKDKADEIFELVRGQMMSQAYNTANTMMCETFVRASTIRYLLTQASGYNRKDLVREQKSLGFLLVDTLVDVLARRELDYEQYPTMEYFMPEFIKAINEAHISLPSGKFDEYDNPDVPDLLPGLFSVGPDKQVQFTRSNLYWDGNDWRLESNQMNYPTKWDPNHVGHFFWTTTASGSYSQWYAEQGESVDDHLFCDGSDAAHTLTVEGISGLRVLDDEPGGELEYLLRLRNKAYFLYRYPVEIANVGECLVLAPDNYSGQIASSYDACSWAAAEKDGLVCLTAAGYRNSDGNFVKPGEGLYLVGTPKEDSIYHSYLLSFRNGFVGHNPSYGSRWSGVSIRLVKDVN